MTLVARAFWGFEVGYGGREVTGEGVGAQVVGLPS